MCELHEFVMAVGQLYQVRVSLELCFYRYKLTVMNQQTPFLLTVVILAKYSVFYFNSKQLGSLKKMRRNMTGFNSRILLTILKDCLWISYDCLVLGLRYTYPPISVLEYWLVYRLNSNNLRNLVN